MAKIFGHAITIVESVCNGESFIIVRNNTHHAIRLNPGVIQPVVRPSVCLPSVLQPQEVVKQEMHQMPVQSNIVTELTRTTDVLNSVRASEEGHDPRTFITWNVSGLSTRIYNKDLEDSFYHKIEVMKPDLISLQEIKLEGDVTDPTKIKEGTKDIGVWDAFMAPLRDQYDHYLSLATAKYGGQAILVRKGLSKPTVTRQFSTVSMPEVYPNGRYIRLIFPNIEVHSVYAPFNGAGVERKIYRRREWDSRLAEEMRALTQDSEKSRIFMGDFK